MFLREWKPFVTVGRLPPAWLQLLRSWLTTACGKMSLIDSTQFCDSILHRWLLCTVRTVVGRDEDQFGKSSSPGELHTTVDSEAAVMCLALRDVVSLDLSRPMHSISLRSSWLRDLLASAPESLAPLLAQTCRLLPGTWLWTGAFGTSCPDSHLLEEACREWEAWAIRCCRNHSLRRGLREMMTFAAFATDHFSWLR
ncbi:hypothetical protein DFJ73DRAFT_427435 [Zopfochytrium polystomum]|nr:hypothetical protein DFJ73DRAFT_427435 [Zopfochytrium polystomum]